MKIKIDYSASEILFIDYETYITNELGILVSFRDKNGFADKREYKIKDIYVIETLENNNRKILRLKFPHKLCLSKVLENTFHYFYLDA